MFFYLGLEYFIFSVNLSFNDLSLGFFVATVVWCFVLVVVVGWLIGFGLFSFFTSQNPESSLSNAFFSLVVRCQ